MKMYSMRSAVPVPNCSVILALPVIALMYSLCSLVQLRTAVRLSRNSL